jgi:hypothetical protein
MAHVAVYWQTIYESEYMNSQKVSRMTLELTRQKMRERALAQFKQLKTCVLARELCVLVRLNRAAFNKKDAKDCCTFISKLCKEAGCEETSELCRKAAEAVMKDEETYLELCLESCRKCGESKRPRKPESGMVVEPEGTQPYVA